MNKLFTVAFAALALAACSNDDDINTGNQGGDNGQNELVDAISISFGSSKGTPGTRVMSSTGTAGVGTENNIYEAFVFAKEADPKHTRPKDGDWTVIRVVADPTTGAVMTETGGVIGDAPANLPDKGSLTKALNNLGGDSDWKVEKVATFSGVRQGDYVYVIANDPNLTLAEATVLAHQGETSEDKIKGYVAALSKEYLDGLKYYPESSSTAAPTGKYVMAGREVVPATPTLPSNGALTVTVGLDRELAKVSFKAAVTLSTADAAFGKVEFQAGDGIMVARIARSVSMFTQQSSEWYVPSRNNVINWPADGTTAATSKLFDGTSTADIADWVTGVDAPANFNKLAPAGSVTEYRYSWVLGQTSAEMIDQTKAIYLSELKDGTMCAPMFYVTPNYSGNTNAVTAIVTQATYTGHNTLVPAVTKEMLSAALHDNTFNGGGAVTEIGENFWDTPVNVTKMYTFLTNDITYKDEFPIADYPDATSLLDYTTGMKLYYRADVADYVGGVSTKLTERNVMYDTKGTIQSLGAKSITDAIMSEANAMHVDVTVNKWKLSINEVPM